HRPFPIASSDSSREPAICATPRLRCAAMSTFEPYVRPAIPADRDVLVEFACAMARETEQRELDVATVRAGVEALLADPTRGRVPHADPRVERVAQRLPLVDPERLRRARAPPARLLPHAARARARARTRGGRRPRAAPLRRARQPSGAGHLPADGDGGDGVP